MSRDNQGMPTMRLFHIFAIFILASLTACGASTGGIKAPPKLETANFTPLSLNARRLEIVENWQMPMEAPYLGHLQTPYPSNVVSEWAATTLRPAGGSGEIIFDISRAAITEIKLPRETGLSSAFTDEQAVKIKAEIHARLMWLQPVGGSQAMANLQATYSVTLPESSTANEFDAAVQEALLQAVAALDVHARKELKAIDNILLP